MSVDTAHPKPPPNSVRSHTNTDKISALFFIIRRSFSAERLSVTLIRNGQNHIKLGRNKKRAGWEIEGLKMWNK